MPAIFLWIIPKMLDYSFNLTTAPLMLWVPKSLPWVKNQLIQTCGRFRGRFCCRYWDLFASDGHPLWKCDYPQCHSVTLYPHLISCTVSNICTDEFVNMFVLVSLYLFPWFAFTCQCCYRWGTCRKIQLPVLMISVSRLLVGKGGNCETM